MTGLIRSLYIDLHNRLSKMTSHLETLTMNTRPSSEFKMETLVKLTELKNKVRKTLENQTLDNDFFIPNNTINYNSLNYEFIEIELFRFLPISKYSDRAEGYFEKVIQSIYIEIHTSQSVPFISTISNSDSYFWAYSKYKMIAAPQGEEKHLLNLGDLYHEIGHLIFIQSEGFLVGDFLKKGKQHFEKLAGTKRGRKPGSLKDKIIKTMHAWENSWAEELACDLVATYLVGPAYAWSHMKICTVSSGYNNIYSHHNVFKEHPADEVRMRAILMMLDKMGCGPDSGDIKGAWTKFLSVTHNDKPDHYDMIFPQELIEAITENVYQGCLNIQLHSYLEQIKKHTRPVSKRINEAWIKIRNEPENFPAWEVVEIKSLHSMNFM